MIKISLILGSFDRLKRLFDKTAIVSLDSGIVTRCSDTKSVKSHISFLSEVSRDVLKETFRIGNSV